MITAKEAKQITDRDNLDPAELSETLTKLIESAAYAKRASVQYFIPKGYKVDSVTQFLVDRGFTVFVETENLISIYW